MTHDPWFLLSQRGAMHRLGKLPDSTADVAGGTINFHFKQGQLWYVADKDAQKLFGLGRASVKCEGEIMDTCRQLDKIFNTAATLFYVHDLRRWPQACVSLEIRAFLGYEAAGVNEAAPASFEDLVYPDDATDVCRYQAWLAASVGLEEIGAIDCRLKHALGQWRWLRVRHTPCQEGKPGMFYCFVQDVTLEKEAQSARELSLAVLSRHKKMLSALPDSVGMAAIGGGEECFDQGALAESYRLLDDIINSSPALILVKDTKGKFMLANRGFEEHMGISSDQFFGKTDYDFCSAEKADYYRANDQEALNHGHLLQFEEVSVMPDGSRRIFLTNKFPLLDAAGNVYAVGGISTDITYLKQIEEELTRAKAAAEKANSIKGQFLANMSHELRTPMNAIKGMTDLLDMTRLDPVQRKYLSFLRSGAKLLLDLINDILDLAKIEAGQLTLFQREFDVASLTSENVDLYRPLIEEKALTFSCSLAEDLPRRVIGDPLRLSQVLGNLLSNAVKFTQSGKISLNVRLLATADDEAKIEFAVADTGIGIPEDQLQQLFIYFSQLDQSITRKYGGSGLGLAISKPLARAMGGDITVASESGKGSTFFLTVALKVADAQSSSVGC